MPSVLSSLGYNQFNRIPSSNEWYSGENPSATIPSSAMNQYIPDRSISKSKVNFDVGYDAVVDMNGGGDYLSLEQAISEGNSNIYLKNGVYPLTRDLTFSIAGMRLTGESQNGVIITGDYQIGFAADDIMVSNFTKSGGSSAHYIYNIAGNRCSLLNSTCSYTTASKGIFTVSGNNFQFSGNTISLAYTGADPTAYTTLFFRTEDTASFLKLYDNTIASSTNLVATIQSAYAIIENNYFQSTPNTTDLSWIVLESTATSFKSSGNVFISGNANKRGYAYELQSVESGNISGDTFEWVGVKGYDNYNSVISGNRFSGSNGTDPYYAIYFDNLSERCLISSNYITGGYHGIFLDDDVGNHIITGNVIKDMNNASGAGIYVYLSKWNNIEGNIVLDSTGYGIYIEDSEANVIGNTIRGSGVDGIYSTGQDNENISSNISTANAGYGLNWGANPASTVCVGNMLDGNVTGALNGSAGANSQFANNVVA